MKKNYWKYIIIALPTAMVTFHITAIIYIHQQDYEITRKDYYQQEQSFEAQVASLRAGEGYQWRANLQREALDLTVLDPQGNQVALENPRVYLYKPDNAASDQTQDLQAEGAGRYRAVLKPVQQGLWRIRVEGKVDGTPVSWKSQFTH